MEISWYKSSQGFEWSYDKINELCVFLKTNGFVCNDFWGETTRVSTRPPFTSAYRGRFSHKSTSTPFGVYLTPLAFEIIKSEYNDEIAYQTRRELGDLEESEESTFERILEALNKCLTEVKETQEVAYEV